jgi:methionyl-tRNA formyltransferase
MGIGRHPSPDYDERPVARPVLFLGRADSPILAHLREVEPSVVAFGPAEPLTPSLIDEHEPHIAVVHGYRLILRRPVLDRLPGHVVNLHIAYLPFNRGSDPNLWSLLEDTPKGVTIHYVDEGVDTGDIIAQRELEFGDDETLASTYAALQEAMLDLLTEQWPDIRDGRCERRPQVGPGTSHRSADRAAVEHLLTAGWDTPVGVLRGAARR